MFRIESLVYFRPHGERRHRQENKYRGDVLLIMGISGSRSGLNLAIARIVPISRSQRYEQQP